MAREPDFDGDRDDRDDDRPRRRRRDDDDRDDRPRGDQPKQVSILGVFSLIKGIGGLIVSLFPCIGIIGGAVCLLGLFLGILGIVVAKKSNQGTGLPIAGTIVSAIGLVIAVVWFAVMSVFFGAVGEVAKEAAKASEEIKRKEVESVRTGPATKVDAVALDKEFDDNQLQAEAKYKGKVLEVSGVVHKVTKDKIGKITVELKGDQEESENSTVDCNFTDDPENVSALAAVTAAKRVTIRGKCKGKVDTYVTLEYCMLVK
ncbi:OB-fold protein [Fimbriiglobus ruber]|uniref:DUF4190 domain-containing protein n=1 Tax=Fimbriiglobus ruber TaxID=1908690 RepID=A0A225DRX9_9BACT|nr:hypothetical protein [Fimbriiglobus ruber]OWK38857.1 hypothetical protein FRUB_06362 [Fimbriiglobus ruber]